MQASLLRVLILVLGIVGVVALALAVFSLLDDDWVPLAIVLPGVVMYIILIWRT
jgi:hypothetical protein